MNNSTKTSDEIPSILLDRYNNKETSAVETMPQSINITNSYPSSYPHALPSSS